MFEFSVACKYLLPRRRQLSVSIISLISVLVIALVVWLIVVFFSVKNGIEKSWIDKLIALTAPVRLTPTEDYYNSYYYRVDGISEQSNYRSKTIAEKLNARETDPYNAYFDEEIPLSWEQPDQDENGHLKDLVKLAYEVITNVNSKFPLNASDFEVTGATLHLNLIRDQENNDPNKAVVQQTQSAMAQPLYLGTVDPENPGLTRGLLPLAGDDISNLLRLASIRKLSESDGNSEIIQAQPDDLQRHLRKIFEYVQIRSLKAPVAGWRIPSQMLQGYANLSVAVLLQGDRLAAVVLPLKKNRLEDLLQDLGKKGFKATPGVLALRPGQQPSVTMQNDEKPYPLLGYMPALVEGGTEIQAELIPDSISSAMSGRDVQFAIELNVQGNKFTGTAPIGQLQIADFTCISHDSPFYVCKHQNFLRLPHDPLFGEAILLPRSYREAGARIGDRGHLAYKALTASTIQEQRSPVYVVGFYDPGIMPFGNKFILADRELVSNIRATQYEVPMQVGNGINIRFNDLTQADEIKQEILKGLQEKGVERYWEVETYREFEHIRDVIYQLQSEKNIFTIISIVIIIVACSNIISMLIILVNDKRTEIGILRSMGASSRSIALIFGFCGVVMGGIGSLIGIAAALLTLDHLNYLVGLISRIQGYDMFNPLFFGETLPTEISGETLAFVVVITACISLLAGVVPAFKACVIRPSQILRSE